MSGELWIEIRGLRVQARIGVTDAELEVERELIFDIDLIPTSDAATETDEIADTVDYSAVAATCERLATEQPHRTLERLAARVADELLASFACEDVGVRVAKPAPPMPQPVDHVAVRLARASRR